jgi:hypothetical protein
MYHTEFQVTLGFTDLSCIRLLVVTTDYTLVLYLSKREHSPLRIGGIHLLFIQFENNRVYKRCSFF